MHCTFQFRGKKQHSLNELQVIYFIVFYKQNILFYFDSFYFYGEM